jgi:hypothetical protein
LPPTDFRQEIIESIRRKMDEAMADMRVQADREIIEEERFLSAKPIHGQVISERRGSHATD